MNREIDKLIEDILSEYEQSDIHAKSEQNNKIRPSPDEVLANLSSYLLTIDKYEEKVFEYTKENSRKNIGKQRQTFHTKSVKKYIFPSIVGVLASMVLFITIFFSPAVIKGESMKPTLSTNDYVLINKHYGNIQRFSVVAFASPDVPKESYVKRVIGLPGDSIAVLNGVLYINNQIQKEPYLEEERKKMESGETLMEDFTLDSLMGINKIPENKLFVMGDNRLYSRDSRDFGLIDMNKVRGEADFVIWPFSNIKQVK